MTYKHRIAADVYLSAILPRVGKICLLGQKKATHLNITRSDLKKEVKTEHKLLLPFKHKVK